jgi:hypothetical protein
MDTAFNSKWLQLGCSRCFRSVSNTLETLAQHTGGCGGIGRRARFRTWYREMWRFESSHPHEMASAVQSGDGASACGSHAVNSWRDDDIDSLAPVRNTHGDLVDRNSTDVLGRPRARSDRPRAVVDVRVVLHGSRDHPHIREVLGLDRKSPRERDPFDNDPAPKVIEDKRIDLFTPIHTFGHEVPLAAVTRVAPDESLDELHPAAITARATRRSANLRMCGSVHLASGLIP